MQSNGKVHLALASVGLIYGANYVIAKRLMTELVGPEALVMWRTSWGALAFLIIHFIFVKEKIKRKRDYALLAAGGFFGIFFNQYLFFLGLKLGSPTNSSVIMTTTPIIVLVCSYFYLKEKISLRKGVGVSIGCLGAILFLGQHAYDWGNDSFTGDLLVLANAASFGVFLVIMKPVMSKYQAITVTKWIFIFGWLMMLPFGLDEALHTNYSMLKSTDWLSLTYILIFSTTFAYILNIKALSKVSPSLVGYYIYLQPVFAAFISISLGIDEWEWPRFFYSLLIFLGVYLVSAKN